MPKRRRGDESSSPIAQTNATLHQFPGATQPSWMLPRGTENGRANGERANVAPVGGRSGQGAQHISMSHDSNGAMSRQATTSNAPTITLAPNANIQSTHGTSAEPIDLVDYESPYAMHNLPTPSPLTAHAQTRVASVGSNSYPLPSPALSDGVTPSPVVSRPDAAHPPRNRGRLPKIRPSPGIASTFTASPMMPSPLSGVSVNPPGSGHPFTVLTANDMRNPQNPRIPSPASIVNEAPPLILRSNVPPPISPGVQSPQGYAQPYAAPAQINTQNPFYKESMLRVYQSYFEQPGLVLNETDIGRKIMLLDAIQRDDLFYLVLSQVFCLQTVLPNYVPQQLSGLPEALWKALERLLRGNEHCSPNVVNWFANFPAPIQNIYASSVSTHFVQQVLAIRNFLGGLPSQLEPLTDTSRKRLAPPLTQDMVDTLNLPSPILQTTLFRMIARSFWGSNDNKGLQILEQIHRIDQDTYFFQQFRRTAAERTLAYQGLAGVYRDFHSYVNAGGRQENFVSPAAVEFFQRVPASTVRARQAPPPTQQSYVLQQHYAQQIQNARPPYSAHMARQPSIPHYGYEQPLVAPPQHLPRLLPGEKDHPRSQPVHPETSRVALHQAHLRSPIPGPKELAPDEQPLYRHVVGYALNPIQLNANLYAQTITFTLTQEEIDKIPKTIRPDLPGGRGTRLLSPGLNLYRLRCVEMRKEGFQTENAWITADNVWPPSLTCEVNSQYLDTRRKLHHGRYLPADLSSILHAGTNTLTLFVTGNITAALAVAIEVVGVSSHASIISNLSVQSSADSLTAIKQSLAGEGVDDDDIVMTSSTLTINLFDPFTADRIFKIPVRGSACLHRDCFDLETFLSQCKREKPGHPCIVDCWRCPICKSDVRPQMLVKDGFLVEVRKELEKRGLLQTRAILVKEDGTWKPKVEEQTTGVRSPSLEREEAEAERAKAKKVVEIIELD